ncbi:MAG: AMP-binding protein [Pseudomonadales bacterium]|nr:AMP-binding protein [Pseudomonadales bacterium]
MNKLDLSDNKNRILPKLLTLQAEQNGDMEYLITDDRRVTFAEAESITNSLAAGLLELGLEKNQRVAFYLKSGIETILTALAVNKAGGIWVPVNTDYKGAWLADTIERSKATILITEASLQDRIKDVESSLNNEKLVVLGEESEISLSNATTFASLLDHSPLTPNYDDMDYGDTCAVLWTSGTTGKSKGVLQSHNSWIRPIAEAASVYYNSQPGDIIYNVLPLYNSGAWITAIFRALYEGIPVVLETKFSVSTFLDRLREFKATQTFTLGAMHMFLFNSPPKPDDADNPLRVAQMVPMPEQLKEPFSKRFGVELLPMGYGQSEVMVVLTPAFCMGEVPFSSLGRPLDDMEIKLFDDDFNEVPQGQIGEICIKPLKPNVIFNGYFDDDKANEDAFTGEWYHTGDLGKIDNNGAYWFVDRKRDAIRFAGRNISTMEVEMVLRKHPSVKDVAAFGLPSPHVESESELAINIVLQDGADITYEQMAEYINDNAPHYFVPQYMEFVTTLPYTPTNKVQKFKLREKGVGENTWKLKESSYEVKR